MDALAYAARAVIAVVFLVAAIGKFAAPATVAVQLEAFGIPRRVSPFASWALPIAEVSVAAMLLVAYDEQWPSWVALGVLAVFTAAIIVNLARGNTSPCACFGVAPTLHGPRRSSISGSPISDSPTSDSPISDSPMTGSPTSARTVFRNGWLLGLALVGTGPATNTGGLALTGWAVGLSVGTWLVLRVAR